MLGLTAPWWKERRSRERIYKNKKKKTTTKGKIGQMEFQFMMDVQRCIEKKNIMRCAEDGWERSLKDCGLGKDENWMWLWKGETERGKYLLSARAFGLTQDCQKDFRKKTEYDEEDDDQPGRHRAKQVSEDKVHPLLSQEWPRRENRKWMGAWWHKYSVIHHNSTSILLDKYYYPCVH